MVRAIELGFPQKEIAEAAYRYQQQLDRGEKTMVGVNRYQMPEEPPIGAAARAAEVEAQQAERVRRVQARARTRRAAREALARGARARPTSGENLMPPIVAAVKATCTRRRDLRRLPRGVRRVPRPGVALNAARPGSAILVAKPGLDGHDRGAKIIARALRDAGFEVIYTGLHQTPEMIAEAAIQEDVDAIGLSHPVRRAHDALPGGASTSCAQRGGDDIADLRRRHHPRRGHRRRSSSAASRAIFTPGATTQEIVEWVRDSVRTRTS